MQRFEARDRDNEKERQRQCYKFRFGCRYSICMYMVSRFIHYGKRLADCCSSTDQQSSVRQNKQKLLFFFLFILFLFFCCIYSCLPWNKFTLFYFWSLESRDSKSCLCSSILEIWNLQRKRQFIIKLSFTFRMILRINLTKCRFETVVFL